MKKEIIDIGKVIREYAKKNHFTDAAIARLIGTTRQNVANIYSKKSIDTQRLKELSIALNHDFFQYYQVDKKQGLVDTKTEASAKFILQIELNGDEALQLGLKQKVLEMLNNK